MCTGSLVLAAAGLLTGLTAATHWRATVLLVDREAAQAAQLMIEYDPQPPFDAGAVAKASEATRERAREYYGDRS